MRCHSEVDFDCYLVSVDFAGGQVIVDFVVDLGVGHNILETGVVR